MDGVEEPKQKNSHAKKSRKSSFYYEEGVSTTHIGAKLSSSSSLKLS